MTYPASVRSRKMWREESSRDLIGFIAASIRNSWCLRPGVASGRAEPHSLRRATVFDGHSRAVVMSESAMRSAGGRVTAFSRRYRW